MKIEIKKHKNFELLKSSLYVYSTILLLFSVVYKALVFGDYFYNYYINYTVEIYSDDLYQTLIFLTTGCLFECDFIIPFLPLAISVGIIFIVLSVLKKHNIVINHGKNKKVLKYLFIAFLIFIILSIWINYIISGNIII
jgi:hypothetical protein